MTEPFVPTPGTYVFGDPANNEQTRMVVAFDMLRMRTQGRTHQAIADHWGTNRVTTTKYLKKALDSYSLPIVEDAKKETLEQIDRMISAWSEPALTDEKAADTLGKWIDKKIKLLGLDAPIQSQVLVTEVSQQEAELQALLAEAKRDELMRESSIKDSTNTG